MESGEKPRMSRSAVALIATTIVSLLIGGRLGYAMSNLIWSGQRNNLRTQLTELEDNSFSAKKRT